MKQTMMVLDPPWFMVTPLGEGMARAMFNESVHVNPIFLVEIYDSRELRCVEMKDVRMAGNMMWGLKEPAIPEQTA